MGRIKHHTLAIIMKVAFALCALVAVAIAQRPGGNHGNHGDHGLGGLIHHEVVALITADSALTVDQCSTKCDALFDLVDGHDETQTDQMCKEVCDCEINKNCPHQHGHHPTTKASNHTSRTLSLEDVMLDMYDVTIYLT